MPRPVIIFDVETCGHDCVSEFITPPDLTAITAAKNLKDPIKVAADLEQRRADATAEYQAKLQRAALDWNLSRIVALAWAIDDVLNVRVCRDEEDEAHALIEFWDATRGRDLIGFCARTFDLPTLIQRSRLLDVDYPVVSLSRYGRGDVIDLRDLLTFDDARYEAIMPRSLKAFAKRFGIPCDDQTGGQDIPAMVAAGDWDGIRAHVTSDVQITTALARKLKRVPQEEPVL